MLPVAVTVLYMLISPRWLVTVKSFPAASTVPLSTVCPKFTGPSPVCSLISCPASRMGFPLSEALTSVVRIAPLPVVTEISPGTMIRLSMAISPLSATNTTSRPEVMSSHLRALSFFDDSRLRFPSCPVLRIRSRSATARSVTVISPPWLRPLISCFAVMAPVIMILPIPLSAITSCAEAIRPESSISPPRVVTVKSPVPVVSGFKLLVTRTLPSSAVSEMACPA